MLTFPAQVNDTTPFMPLKMSLSRCRVAIVTTAGLHRRGDHPFGPGDPTYRIIASDTPALEIVQSQFPGVIKILVSDRPNLEEAVYAFNNAGLDRYVAKPWEPEDLRFTVTSLLRQAAIHTV